ncbi:MAG: hypothetical protein K2X87_06540 [Gemmataceae bacterium]|nr:hypothetical protein [Gemmataceae bacterium]
MVRLFAGSLFAAAAVALSAPADDKKDEKKDKPALSGTWTREAGGLDLKFEFAKDKEEVKVTALAGDNGAVVTCKYAVKDGRVTLTVKEVEEKGEFPQKPPVGFEMKFKWTVKGDTATLDDLEGLDDAKPVLEGEYQKKKAKD